MQIQSASAYTAFSFPNNSPQQRQTSASATAIFAASAASVADKTTISQAARNRVAEESNDDQWLAALANRRTGVPQLIKADSALAGGRADIQGRLQQLLADHAVDPNTSFTLAYDAASRSFRVDGVPEAKAALEAELNSSHPSATGAAVREGYSLLSDMASGLAAVREQYARDQIAGGNDIASRQQGYADRFSLGMRAGILSTRLEA